MVYPPDSLPGIKDVNAAIRHALLNPIDAEPLPELLTPGMKLTIAIDDISLPLPPMSTPDIRQRIIEHVVELAARKGVEDVEADRRERAAPPDDRLTRSSGWSASACSVRSGRTTWPTSTRRTATS